MQIDVSLLKELNKEKLVSLVPHPSGELFLANYTPICQYKRAWDTYPLLLDCRGLIFTPMGEVIAKPFKKFFNLGEPGTTLEDLTGEIPEISVKLDGSMGSRFVFKNEAFIATRGAFESSQALWATQYLRHHYVERDFSSLYTYLFEIIYPENRIVIDYGLEESLILIGMVRLEDGYEEPYSEVFKEAMRLNIPCTPLIESDAWEDLAHEEKDNFEGYVLNFPKSGKKVKVKLKQYIELHKLVTDMTNKRIWEAALEPERLTHLFSIAPDEVYKWVEETLAAFYKEAEELRQTVESAASQAQAQSQVRREQAIWIMQNHRDISGMIFSLLDGKNIDKQIWAAIEPTEKVAMPNMGLTSQTQD